MILKGRREIFTDAKEITEANVCEVMNKAFSIHLQNAAEITAHHFISFWLVTVLVVRQLGGCGHNGIGYNQKYNSHY